MLWPKYTEEIQIHCFSWPKSIHFIRILPNITIVPAELRVSLDVLVFSRRSHGIMPSCSPNIPKSIAYWLILVAYIVMISSEIFEYDFVMSTFVFLTIETDHVSMVKKKLTCSISKRNVIKSTTEIRISLSWIPFEEICANWCFDSWSHFTSWTQQLKNQDMYRKV